MEPFDFHKTYISKSDDELIRLSLAQDQLTDEAKSALQVVLNARKLTDDARLEEFRREEETANDVEERQIEYLGNTHIFGIGRQRFGKSDYVYDPTSKLETFTTTLFLVLFYLPLFPVGMFRIQREKRLFLLAPRRLLVLQKLPISWTQILWAWTAASLCAVGLFVALDFWVIFKFR